MDGNAALLRGGDHAPSDEDLRDAIIVLGMHRSGTSAFTRVVGLMGAELASDMLGPRKGNERGHWEPRRLLNLHEDMLAAAGSRWDDWRRLDLTVIPPERLAWYRSEIKRLVQEDYAAGPLMVIKEPRVCRFARFYAGVLGEIGVGARFLIPFRNPLAVIASLNARDGMSPSFASLIWLRHVIDAEAATRDRARAFASYERLLADWRQSIHQVGARLGLRWPRSADEAAAEVEAFLTTQLQHHAPSRRELEARADITAWVKEIYAACCQLERNPDAESALQTFDDVAAAMDASEPLYGAAMFEELAVREAEFLRTRAADAESARAALAQREVAFEAMQRDAAQAHEAQVAQLKAEGQAAVQAAVATHERMVTGLSEALAERSAELAGLRIEIIALKREQERARSIAAQADAAAAEIAALQAEALRLRAELDAQSRERAEAAERARALGEEVAVLRGERARAEALTEEVWRLRNMVTMRELDIAKLKAREEELVHQAAASESARARVEDTALLEAAYLRAALADQAAQIKALWRLAPPAPPPAIAPPVAPATPAVARAANYVAHVAAPASPSERKALSIVVPCYNQGQFVWDFLSVLKEETELSYEVLVVNDGSTAPQTLRALEEIKNEPRVTIINQENGGLSAARNAGLKAARGEFVVFLDADDVLTPGLTDRVRKARDSGADVTIFDYVISNEYVTYFERPEPYTISDEMLTLEGFKYGWERGLSVPIHCALFRRDKIRACFDQDLKAKEDWCFWVTNFHLGMRAAYVPELQAIYRQTSSNMTKDVSSMMQSWLLAARHLAEIVDDREEFMTRSMQHVKNYYVPVLQWQSRYVPTSKSFAERAFRKAWLHWSDSPTKLQAAARILRDARKVAQRRAALATQAVTRAVSTAPTAARHAARRAYFNVRRTSPARNATFSVVVPVFNHAAHLSACFTSLTDQSHKPVEIFAVDDCSTDPKAREIMEIYARGNPGLFKAIYNETNQGISRSQNRAVEQASGEWIVFVDCDDSLKLNALRTVARAINRREDIGYFFSDRMRIDELSGRKYLDAFGGRPDLLNKPFAEALRESMVASHLKVIRRDVYLDLGGCDSAFDGVQDWDFAIRALNRGVRFSYIPEPIYNYRWHNQSVSLSAATKQWRLANQVRAQKMFSKPRRTLPPHAVRRLLGEYRRVGLDAQGRAHHARGPKELALYPSVIFDIATREDLAIIERMRCQGYEGVMSGVISAPYEAHLAGQFRVMSGFLDLIVTHDPSWVVALAPVAPFSDHVVLHRET